MYGTEVRYADSDEGMLERPAESHGRTLESWRSSGDRDGIAGIHCKVFRDLVWDCLSGMELKEFRSQLAVRLVSELGVDCCAVLEVGENPDPLVMVTGVGFKEGYNGTAQVGPYLESQAGYTLICPAGVVVVEDHGVENRFAREDLLSDHDIASGVTAVVGGNSGPFGVLGVHRREARRWTDEEVELVVAAAALLGRAYDRHARDERERHRLGVVTRRAMRAEEQLRFLYEASEIVAAAADRETAATCAARIAVPALADWCFVYALEAAVYPASSSARTGEDIRRVAAAHPPGQENEQLASELGRRCPINRNVASGVPRVIRTGRPERVEEVHAADLASAAGVGLGLDLLQRLDPVSYACVPLQAGQQSFGALVLVNTRTDRRFREDDVRFLETYARQVSMTFACAPEPARAGDPANGGRQALVERADETNGAPLLERGTALTDRQREILGLVDDGYTDKEISRLLHISDSTVRNHIYRATLELGVDSRAQAIRTARTGGLLAG